VAVGRELDVAMANRPLLLTNADVIGSGRSAAAFYLMRSQQNALR